MRAVSFRSSQSRNFTDFTTQLVLVVVCGALIQGPMLSVELVRAHENSENRYTDGPVCVLLLTFMDAMYEQDIPEKVLVPIQLPVPVAVHIACLCHRSFDERIRDEPLVARLLETVLQNGEVRIKWTSRDPEKIEIIAVCLCICRVIVSCSCTFYTFAANRFAWNRSAAHRREVAKES